MEKIFFNFFMSLIIVACSSQEVKEAEMINNAQAEVISSNNSVLKQKLSLVSILQNANKGEELSNFELVDEYKKEFFEVSDIDIKCDLVIAIAELDQINSVDFFIRALVNPEPRVRQEAAVQMKQMVVNQDVRNALFLALDEPDSDVLIEVIEALADVREKRVQNKLHEIANSHADSLIREVALDYAVRMGSLE